MPGADFQPVSPEWLARNIRAHGPLGALYPLPAYIMEGDTPSFLSLIPNGLGNPERPDWGAWGGRYDRLADGIGLWAGTADTVTGVDGLSYSTPQATVWRWRSAFQNDFAARIQWSVKADHDSANHAPVAQVNGTGGLAPLLIDTCPGEAVRLSAAGSTDPDGDGLHYRWFWYREASGLFAPSVTLSAASGETTEVTIGATASTDQFTPPAQYPLHVILEVTDDGAPALTRYRRAILTVPGASSPHDTGPCRVMPQPPVH